MFRHSGTAKGRIRNPEKSSAPRIRIPGSPLRGAPE